MRLVILLNLRSTDLLIHDTTMLKSVIVGHV